MLCRRLFLHPQGRPGVNGSRPGYVALDVGVVGEGLPAGWQLQAKVQVMVVNHRDPALSIVFRGEWAASCCCL